MQVRNAHWRERLEATQAPDLGRALARARLYEPRMGRVEGKVVELGPSRFPTVAPELTQLAHRRQSHK